MALLTDQIFASGVSLNDLIHIVITGDTSQNPAGSSFKASIAQVAAAISGTSGSSGSSGISGSSGTSGNDGTSGSSGSSGLDGTFGSSGSSGSSGASGSSGTDGTSGSSGTSGNDGTSGSSGTSGLDGSSGSSGTSGLDGTSGSSGTSGISGTDGTSGFAGVDGALSSRWLWDPTTVSPSYFTTNSSIISSITTIDISIYDINLNDYYTLLTKVQNSGFAITITDVSNNSILGSWDLSAVTDNTTYFTISVGNTFAANGSLNSLSYYSISFNFAFTGSNGTSGSSGSSGSAGTSGVDGSGRSWGSFLSTVDQSATVSGTTYIMSADTTTGSSGVTLSANTRFVVTNPGVYNIQFSAQLNKTTSSKNNVFIWLSKNGIDVPDSNTDVTVAGGSNERIVAAWNWVDEATTANTYYEIKWGTTGTNIYLDYEPSPIVGPIIPSLIVTLTEV